MSKPSNILVIKLSALGDFIQAFGAMRAIKAHHSDASITLLTTKSYAQLAEKSGYFHHIIIDERPKLFQIKKWFNLTQILNAKRFSRVYDLQYNDRTSIYFKLFIKKPEWVGIAKNASHRNVTTDKNTTPAFNRHKQTLSLAGIEKIKIDKLEWIESDISHFYLKDPHALIIAGSAPSRPEKRWDATHYADLCKKLIEQGIQPILLGTKSEKNVTDKIQILCPKVINLTEKTSLFDIIALARTAIFAIGNDTGPMHMIAPTGCQTLVLFSKHSNPIQSKPLGENVRILQKDNINNISVDEVLENINTTL